MLSIVQADKASTSHGKNARDEMRRKTQLPIRHGFHVLPAFLGLVVVLVHPDVRFTQQEDGEPEEREELPVASEWAKHEDGTGKKEKRFERSERNRGLEGENVGGDWKYEGGSSRLGSSGPKSL